MAAGTPAEADVRRAVRAVLSASLPPRPSDPVTTPPPVDGVEVDGVEAPLVLAAVSGGADSLALAAALVREAGSLDVRAGAVIVDHGLQPGSGAAAATAAQTCRRLGLDLVRVVGASVHETGDGPEASARTARYAALDAVAEETGAELVLLGHTRDDQAEQVLLGLTRGSGARSLAGMPAARGRYRRPFLDIPRETTRAVCAALGLQPWQDPMNADPRYARVRARHALGGLEDELGPGLAAALARSADLLRADADLLDGLAADALARLEAEDDARAAPVDAPPDAPVDAPVEALAALPEALRTRVLRTLLLRVGCPPGQLSAAHVAEVDRLLVDWRGQGPLHLPGGVRGSRRGARLLLGRSPRVE